MNAEAARELDLVLASDPKDNELRLYLVRSLLGSAKYARALDTVQQLRHEEADSAILRELTGEALLRLDRIDDAISELKAAAEKFPSEPGIHYGIGFIYWTRHEDDEAEPELKAEVSQDPSNAHSWALLGDIEIRRNKPD